MFEQIINKKLRKISLLRKLVSKKLENKIYLREGILLFKIRDRLYFKDTAHIKHTLSIWARNNPTDRVRNDS